MITIEEFKKKQLNTSRLIGLDLGSKRIGVAICDENQKIATPLKTINKTKFEDLINELWDIIKENNIKGIIIGNPINILEIVSPFIILGQVKNLFELIIFLFIWF